MTSRRLAPWGILSRYIARSHIRPFFIGFSVVTFLLTLDFLLDYLDLFLVKGIPLWTVARLFVLGLGWMIALSVPCGVLVAVLMAYGQMSQDNEVTALRASGVNLFAAMVPSLLLAGGMAVGLTLFNNYVLPNSNHAFANLAAEIHRLRPTAQIREGIFIDDFEGYSLFIKKLDDRTGQMREVLIIDATENRRSPRTILARQGEIRYLPGQNAILLSLRDGTIHELDPEAQDERYRRLTFEQQDMVLSSDSDAFTRGVKRSRGQREMSVTDLRREIGSLRGELASHQAALDSSLVALDLHEVRELRRFETGDTAPSGLTRMLWAVAGFLGRRPSGIERPPDVPPEQRRLIEDAKIRALQADGVRKRIDQLEVEIQKKFSIPFACIVFVLIGAPLGMKARRGGITVGFLSVAFFLFYYLCLIGGEQLADRGLLQPWFSMWLPNLVLGIGGMILTVQISRWGFPVAAARKART